MVQKTTNKCRIHYHVSSISSVHLDWSCLQIIMASPPTQAEEGQQEGINIWTNLCQYNFACFCFYCFLSCKSLPRKEEHLFFVNKKLNKYRICLRKLMKNNSSETICCWPRQTSYLLKISFPYQNLFQDPHLAIATDPELFYFNFDQFQCHLH